MNNNPTCGDCTGACCRNVSIAVTIDDSVPAEYCISGCGYSSMKLVKSSDGQKCICLGPDNKCIIYENRPSTCQEFEMGGLRCKALVWVNTKLSD